MCGNSKKLLFPLCRMCSDKKPKKCNHKDEERTFIGTWCSSEIEVALKKGYQKIKIYEVWNFEERTDELFKEYVRKFLKLKMESSPLVVGEKCTYKSEEEFKNVVKEKLGMELGKIEHNPGMRAISKMCLNSLWGKFDREII